jgi:hypothetical protein
MTVLQLRPAPRVAVEGSFTAPDLSQGSMTGWVRILHYSVQGSRLRCFGVVSGELHDQHGSRLGLASTRCRLPVRQVSPGDLLVGPLDVRLLGFWVHVGEVHLRSVAPVSRPEPAEAPVVPLFGRRS